MIGVVAVGVVLDVPAMAAHRERGGLDALAVGGDRLEEGVVADPEHVVPARPGGGGGRDGVVDLRRRRRRRRWWWWPCRPHDAAGGGGMGGRRRQRRGARSGR